MAYLMIRPDLLLPKQALQASFSDIIWSRNNRFCNSIGIRRHKKLAYREATNPAVSLSRPCYAEIGLDWIFGNWLISKSIKKIPAAKYRNRRGLKTNLDRIKCNSGVG